MKFKQERLNIFDRNSYNRVASRRQTGGQGHEYKH